MASQMNGARQAIFEGDKLLSLLVFSLALLVFPAGGADAQQRIAASYPGIAGYNIPFWVALDAGEFKKAGLEVDPVLISGGSKSMQALLAGGLDFAHTSGGVSLPPKRSNRIKTLEAKESALPASAATTISACGMLSKRMASTPIRM